MHIPPLSSRRVTNTSKIFQALKFYVVNIPTNLFFNHCYIIDLFLWLINPFVGYLKPKHISDCRSFTVDSDSKQSPSMF